MARQIDIVARSASSAVATAVPDDVAAELVTLWEYIQEHPEFAALATFDTEAEVTEFDLQARSWAASNKLVVRRVRTKDLPKNQYKFTIKLPEPDKETPAPATPAAPAPPAA